MPIYRATVIVEVEADNEDEAAAAIENEVSQSAFEGISAIWEVESDHDQII